MVGEGTINAQVGAMSDEAGRPAINVRSCDIEGNRSQLRVQLVKAIYVEELPILSLRKELRRGERALCQTEVRRILFERQIRHP